MNGDHTYASSSYVTPEVDRQMYVGVQVNTLPEDNPQIEVTVQEVSYILINSLSNH